jgi:hypothetical protein
MVRFYLPVAGEYKLSIYDAAGRLVDRFSGRGSQGWNSLNWNAGDGSLASGVYFGRMEAGRHTDTTRMVLLK